MSQSYALPFEPKFSNAPISTPARKILSGKDAIAGAVGGTISVLLGQPFDLIKVRLQTANSSNVLRVAKDVWTHEGPLAFYKGALLPFLGVGASVSVQFATFHSVRQAFDELNAKTNQGTQHLSNGQAYLAGAAAGVANSVISGPVEHIRTRLQLQPHGSGKIYAGAFDCIKKIVGEAGLSGLYKGYNFAVAREFQAYGCYFATFEGCIRGLGHWKGKERRDMSTWEVIPCGALAGIAFWIGSYPIDVIKSKLQSDGFGQNARYKNAWSVAVDTWHVGGFRGFWRGLTPTLIRTSLSSAGCFAAVEQVRKLI